MTAASPADGSAGPARPASTAQTAEALRRSVARQFGRRKFFLYSLRLSHYATSFLSPIGGTCTSSSNRER